MNRTIDDTIGDLVTGAKPTYIPSSGVWDDTTCVGCAIVPETTKAFRGTWNAATYNRNIPEVSVQFSFTGIAVYVYFILANNQGDGITTITQANFTLDGKLISTFTHNPTTSFNLDYNQLVFSSAGLTNEEHTLKASISGIDHDVYINFDYANYTHIEDTDAVTSTVRLTASSSFPSPSTSQLGLPDSKTGSNSTNLGAIIGGIIGGGVLVITMVILIFVRRKHRRRFDNGVSTTDQAIRSTPIDPSTDYRRDSETSNAVVTPFEGIRASEYHDELVSSLPSGKAFLSSLGLSSSISRSSTNGFRKNLTSSHMDTRSDLVSTIPSQSSYSPEERRQRQQELERQMNLIQAEIRALNHEAAERRASTNRGHPEQGEEQVETVQLREQVQMLQEQIHVLRTQNHSDLALYFNDEPPPEYSQAHS